MSSNLKFKTDKLKDFILDLLFPKFCLGCQKEGFYICHQCFEKIEINKFSNCFICGKRTSDNQVCQNCQRKTKLTGLLIASDWENLLLRQIIYEYKYRFIKDLSKPLGQIMINYLKSHQLINSSTNQIILIPIPLHSRRFVWRGFNQAELLAQEVGKYFNLSVRTDILKRTRHTLPQMDIKEQKERQENISQAFSWNPDFNQEIIKNKIIILIDDVCTTGSTLEECAKIFKPLKPKEIWGLVIARG